MTKLCDLPVLAAELSLDGKAMTLDFHFQIYQGRVWLFENCSKHRAQTDIFFNGPHLQVDFMQLNWLEFLGKPEYHMPLTPAHQAPLWQGQLQMLTGYFSKYRGTGEQALEKLSISFSRWPGAGKIQLQAQLGPCLNQCYGYVWPEYRQLSLSFMIADSQIDEYLQDSAQNQAYRVLLKQLDQGE